jgi:hypothetical protein
MPAPYTFTAYQDLQFLFDREQVDMAQGDTRTFDDACTTLRFLNDATAAYNEGVNEEQAGVGIATFVSFDVTGGIFPRGSFLVPVSIVKDFMNRANVEATESLFTSLFRQALIDYSAGRYEETLATLQQLNLMAPNNPDVLKHLINAQTRVLSGTGTDERLTPGNLTSNSIANSTISSDIALDADTILEGLQ